MTQRRGHKRIRGIAVRVAVFLFLGAVVNVAVAWGCALWSSGNTEIKPVYNVPIPSEYERFLNTELTQGRWLDAMSSYSRAGGFGITTKMWGGQKHSPGNLLSLNPDRIVLLQYSGWPSASLRCEGFFNNATAAVGISSSQRVWWIDGAVTSLTPERAVYGTGFPNYGHVLPLRPIWLGFAINTVFYAAILWMLFAAPGRVRRWRRIRRGLCAKCAYPVGTSEVCTECGAQISNTIRGRGCMSLRVANGDGLASLSRGESPSRPAPPASEGGHGT